MRDLIFAGGAIVLAVFLASCKPQPRADSDPSTADAARARQARELFASGQRSWREQRRAELTQPDGWTSLVGLHWLDPGAHYLGSDADNGIRLAKGPPHLGMVELRNGALRFVPEKGAAVRLDGKPVSSAVALRADDASTGPSRIEFDDGKGLATVIKRGERFALRVKHADAPSRLGFKGIDYWPARTEWRLYGKYQPHPAGRTLAIANIIGTIDEVPNPGAVEFERNGRTFRLEALDQGDGGLFLVFADRTSGHGSYGAGRFLDAPTPDAQGRVLLDFNRAYNPPCAFTPFATCPLPPPENRLDLVIDAGEKTYHPGAPPVAGAPRKG